MQRLSMIVFATILAASVSFAQDGTAATRAEGVVTQDGAAVTREEAAAPQDGAAAPREGIAGTKENEVPKTFEGSGDAFKEGGHEIGEGFRGLGRGIKKTFKGEAAKGEYQKTRKIGEGFKDIGRGTAGGGRAVGRSIKKGVEANEDHGERPDPDERSGAPQGSTMTDEELHD